MQKITLVITTISIAQEKEGKHFQDIKTKHEAKINAQLLHELMFLTKD